MKKTTTFMITIVMIIMMIVMGSAMAAQAVPEAFMMLPTTETSQLVGVEVNQYDEVQGDVKIAEKADFIQLAQITNSEMYAGKNLCSNLFDYESLFGYSHYNVTSVTWLEDYSYEFFEGNPEKLLNLGVLRDMSDTLRGVDEDTPIYYSFRWVSRETIRKGGARKVAMIGVSGVVYEVYHFTYYERRVVDGQGELVVPVDFWAFPMGVRTMKNTDKGAGYDNSQPMPGEPTPAPVADFTITSKPDTSQFTITPKPTHHNWDIGDDGSHDGWSIDGGDTSQFTINPGTDGGNGGDNGGNSSSVGDGFTITHKDETTSGVGDGFTIKHDSDSSTTPGGNFTIEHKDESSNTGNNFSIEHKNETTDTGDNFSIEHKNETTDTGNNFTIDHGGSSSSAGTNFTINSDAQETSSSSSSSSDVGNNFSIGDSGSSSNSSSSSSSNDSGSAGFTISSDPAPAPASDPAPAPASDPAPAPASAPDTSSSGDAGFSIGGGSEPASNPDTSSSDDAGFSIGGGSEPAESVGGGFSI